jgi:phosphoglucomutase
MFVAFDCWFAGRLSGTEEVTMRFAESFRWEVHLAAIIDDARAILAEAGG